MMKRKDEYLSIDNIDDFDYVETKKLVDQLFQKYRSYKTKEDIINKRYNASLSLDNLGIFSSKTSDPVGDKVEQLERYKNFTDTIDKIYNLNCSILTKDEDLIYKKILETKHSEETVMEYLNLASKSGYYTRKRNCYLKVAMWFDLEVYKS